jgi:hypothetical protein
MLSGAFHDALFVNRIAPAAMIFVPCRDGLSHNEAEYVEPAHSIAGARMLLASTLEVLAYSGANEVKAVAMTHRVLGSPDEDPDANSMSGSE